jgi:TolA-binding protein
MSAPEFRLGEETVCPKCGQRGKLGLHVVYAKGYKYTYLAVLHPAVYGRKEKKPSVKHCTVRLLSKEPAKREAAKPQPSQTAAKPEAEERLRQLEEENRQLRAQLERLQAENEQLRQALVSVYNARLSYRKGREEGERPLVVGATERYYLKLVAKDKKTDRQIAALGLSPAEVRAVANGIIEALVSTDFAAVRLDAWQQLEGVVARWL